jgi:hypothetical protein
VAAGVALGALAAPSFSAAATFTVTNTNDSGAGSLRQAIIDSNGNPGADTIAFNIVGVPPHSIKPLSALPTITGQVTVDGTTQPGFLGIPIVELDGSLALFAHGLDITAGNSTVRGLAINRFTGAQRAGIALRTAGGNVVEGNFLGTNVTGATALGNSLGVLVSSSPNNTIGGTTSAKRNVISGNQIGIEIGGTIAATGNHIEGNLVGTSASGTAAVPNTGAGVSVFTPNNTIGGTAAGTRNVISGNEEGVILSFGNATGNHIEGNFIGTDVSGNLDLGNNGNGVRVENAPNNTIGGTTAAARNVISGNGGTLPRDGIRFLFSGATGNKVQGNHIGTNASGTAALSNSGHGVHIDNSPSNTIGGTTASDRNVISGNGQINVFIRNSGSTGNKVQGNFVGTDATGSVGIGGPQGVTIEQGAQNNTIGGTTPGARNVISGNLFGVLLGSAGNQVQGNFIGTDAAGTGALGNAGSGILVFANNSTIGGTAGGAGNTIAFNGQNGVAVLSGTGNGILTNSIFSNGQLGIDLGDDGVTANDPGDGDAGPNNRQNFPVLTSVTSSGGSTTVQGTLNSQANTTYRLEFFSNPSCDFSGHGEGKTFLGSHNVTTNGTGNASFTATLSAGVSSGEFVTSTATDPIDNTSEFSMCQPVAAGPGPPATLTLSPPADTNDVETEHCVKATVKDASGNPVPNITVRFTVTGSVNTGGSATTDASGEAEFCYQGPELPGADAITAFADTDNDQTQDAGEPTGAAEKTWVVPVSTPLCEVKLTKGGRITADNGDKATFGGNVQVSDAGTPKGDEEYRDHGPADPMRVKSTQILVVICPTTTEATIFGTATIDGQGTHLFKIDVQDLGEPGVGQDTYRILLDTGYDSGEQVLEGGNVQIHKG